MADLFDTIATLRQEKKLFAVATVVARRAPVSAHLGDRAIIHADGRMEGFVGGACAREIVRKQALDCIRARHGRLVSIRPDASDAAPFDPEHVTISMTCASEGAVDVYVEPFVQPRRLVVVGATPVAEALARVARSADYDVVRVVDAPELRDLQRQVEASGIDLAPLENLEQALDRDPSDLAVVVASQGHYDEQAVEIVLRHGAAYIGLVASRKRGGALCALLEDSGTPDVGRVRYPAGLDLGARTPPEVALSILAEIVHRSPAGVVASESVPASHTAGLKPCPTGKVAQVAIDPVCGMEVEIATARHSAEVDGATYYFCCPHCRARFLEEPRSYLSSQS